MSIDADFGDASDYSDDEDYDAGSDLSPTLSMNQTVLMLKYWESPLMILVVPMTMNYKLTTVVLQVLQADWPLMLVLHNIQVVPNWDQAVVGYTLCGDNIDKNVKRRYQRSDRGTISLHYFHMYAVQDRVNHSLLCEDRPQPILMEEAKAAKILPSKDDDKLLKKKP